MESRKLFLTLEWSPEGIEPVRQLILRDAYDPGMSDLPQTLVAVSTIMEPPFPEYAEWKKAADAREAQIDRRIKAMSHYGVPGAGKPKKRKDRPHLAPAPPARSTNHLGRNHPCAAPARNSRSAA